MPTKPLLVSLAALATVAAGTAHASDVSFSFGINVPLRTESYQPVYAPPPPPPVVIAEPPEFIMPQQLGIYAAVGVPYDLFYAADRYYLCRGNAWYSAPRYNGPWVEVRYRHLPRELRRYPFAKIRTMRDEAYLDFCDDDHHDRWRHFRPARGWRDLRHGERGEWREARWREHERRRHWREDDDD